MSDLALAISLFIAILAAGSLRAHVDKNITIFYLSAISVAVMSSAIALYEAGLFPIWVEFLFIVFMTLLGAAISAFCSLSKRDIHERSQS